METAGAHQLRVQNKDSDMVLKPMTCNRSHAARLVLSCSLFFIAIPTKADDQTAIDFFEKKIRPVLVKHCYSCHSSQAAQQDKLQANLHLDTRDGVQRGGDSGPALQLKDPNASLLISALRYDDLKMPPKQQLPAHVIVDFEKWIEIGAPDPREQTANSPARKTSDSEDGHWSFQPLKKAKPPQLKRPEWAQTEIDHFVLSRLEQNNLPPVIDAKPNVLARRIYFDLIGLPPTPEQIDAFEQEFTRNPQSAFPNLVDRLLASEHFGERWARHWLDLVRYAETNGGDRNVIWPHAWRYRDYVIDSFNADKPFDQFVREQIAGDLLPFHSREQRDEQLIATGMLTMGPKLFMETKAERFKMDVVDEQMDVVGRAVLGLTISCARCHDHKFDSISTADYYGLAGIFRSTYLLYGTAAPAGNQYGHDRPLQPIGKDCETLVGPAEAWKKSVADQTAARNKARSDRYRVVRKKAAQENQLEMLSNGKTEQQQTANVKVQALTAEIEELDAEIKQWDDKIKKLDEQLKQTVDNPPPLPDYAMAVRDAEEPVDCQICIRGEYNRLGESVSRGFLAEVPHQQVGIPVGQSGRLQLASWLTDKRNPLTARVAVNRIWRHLFGEGLVRSVNNFGVMGQQPSHPQLLDYLAVELQQNDWSIKRMIRRIVLSRSYQLSSRHRAANYAVDPDNRFLWRMNRRRLQAEPLRDALLAIGGGLDLNRSDGSVISKDLAKERELNATVKLSDEQLRSKVRSIYLPVARMSLPSTMKIWNFPDPSLITGRRSDRPLADQQLFFLNSPLVIEQSSELAKRLVADHQEVEPRIREVWRRIFARSPDQDELQNAVEYISQRQTKSTVDEHTAWTLLCQALFASGEFRYIE
jgi:hypothetical protein